MTVSRLPEGDDVAQPHGVVLVVDDSEANRDVLCRRLIRAGYSTIAACGGEQAGTMGGPHSSTQPLVGGLIPVGSTGKGASSCHAPMRPPVWSQAPTKVLTATSRYRTR